jgi:predicted nucleotidyltransferase
LGTVEITWFDRAAVERALQEHVRHLSTRHPEIEEIVLFGSMAKGRPVPGSDVDLLIVLSASYRPFLDRIPAFLPDRFPVGVDVFPYTRHELERMNRDGNALVRAALRDGIVLFKRVPESPT